MAMDSAHDTALNDLISEVCDTGSAKITERELLRCFPDNRNLSRAIWRDLAQRFDDETERRKGIGDEWEGYWLAMLRQHSTITLVALHPIDVDPSDKDERWWTPVAELAGNPLNNTRPGTSKKAKKSA